MELFHIMHVIVQQPSDQKQFSQETLHAHDVYATVIRYGRELAETRYSIPLYFKVGSVTF